jgi:hypothetical protein
MAFRHSASPGDCNRMAMAKTTLALMRASSPRRRRSNLGAKRTNLGASELSMGWLSWRESWLLSEPNEAAAAMGRARADTLTSASASASAPASASALPATGTRGRCSLRRGQTGRRRRCRRRRPVGVCIGGTRCVIAKRGVRSDVVGGVGVRISIVKRASGGRARSTLKPNEHSYHYIFSAHHPMCTTT